MTPQQHALRRTGIGGSEIAAIMGLSPFMSPLDVYLAKVEGFVRPVSPDMERGLYLEDGIARWYAARTGTQLSEVGTLRHTGRSSIPLCTPDRLVSDGQTKLPRILSIKAPGNWLSEEWGEPHAWEAPTAYWCQLQYEMGICRALGCALTDWAHLAAPLAGDLAIIKVDEDRATQERLFDEAEAWWIRHVVPKTPPPLDCSDAARQWLRRRYPRDTAPVRPATLDEQVLLLDLLDAEMACAAADGDYKVARRRVEEAIGTAGGIEGADGRVTWRADKAGKRSFRTRWTT